MTVYDDKTPSVVTPFNGSSLNYGFLTNIADADRAVLGHQTLDAAGGAVVFGASRPKPARLTRERTASSVSSFVDWQSYNSAIAAGFKQSRGAILGPSPYSSARAVRVVAEPTPGVNIAWDMRRTQFDRISGDLAALGIEVLNATNGRNAAVGVNSIEGAATALLGARSRQGDDILSVGYVGHTRADNLPEGWTAVERSNGVIPTTPVS